MTSWHTRIGRLSDRLLQDDPRRCEHPDCPVVIAPYLARTDWIGEGPAPTASPRFGRFCVNHASALAYQYHLTLQTWQDGEVSRPPRLFEIPPGTPIATCRSCRENIRWIVTGNGRRMPVNLDGSSHFATCPDADQHRRRR